MTTARNEAEKIITGAYLNLKAREERSKGNLLRWIDQEITDKRRYLWDGQSRGQIAVDVGAVGVGIVIGVAVGATSAAVGGALTAASLGTAAHVVIPLTLAAIGGGGYIAGRVAAFGAGAVKNTMRRSRTWIHSMEHRDLFYKWEEKGVDVKVREAGLNQEMLAVDAMEALRSAVDHYRKVEKRVKKLKSRAPSRPRHCGELADEVELQMELFHEIWKTENNIGPCIDLLVYLLWNLKRAVQQWSDEPQQKIIEFLEDPGRHAGCSPGACIAKGRDKPPAGQPKASLKSTDRQIEYFDKLIKRLLTLRDAFYKDYGRTVTDELSAPKGSPARAERAAQLFNDALRFYDIGNPFRRADHYIKNVIGRTTRLEKASFAITESAGLVTAAGSAAAGYGVSIGVTQLTSMAVASAAPGISDAAAKIASSVVPAVPVEAAARAVLEPLREMAHQGVKEAAMGLMNGGVRTAISAGFGLAKGTLEGGLQTGVVELSKKIATESDGARAKKIDIGEGAWKADSEDLVRCDYMAFETRGKAIADILAGGSEGVGLKRAASSISEWQIKYVASCMYAAFTSLGRLIGELKRDGIKDCDQAADLLKESGEILYRMDSCFARLLQTTEVVVAMGNQVLQWHDEVRGHRSALRAFALEVVEPSTCSCRGANNNLKHACYGPKSKEEPATPKRRLKHLVF
jgi:hypothetical protein